MQPQLQTLGHRDGDAIITYATEAYILYTSLHIFSFSSLAESGKPFFRDSKESPGFLSIFKDVVQSLTMKKHCYTES